MRLRSIEDKLLRHEEMRGAKIEQHQMSLRSHTERVIQKGIQVKEASNTDGFSKKERYYKKVEKSLKAKQKEDEAKIERLKDYNHKRDEAVEGNLHEIKHKHKQQVRYYDTRLKERNNKVEEVRNVLKEDIDTKKELNMLRKADQEENFLRGMNIHNIYKQKLVEKIIEKRERAEKIKEQQMRIADLCRVVRAPPTHQQRSLSPLMTKVNTSVAAAGNASPTKAP